MKMIEYAPAIVGVMCVILALFVNRATDSIFKQVKKEVRLTLEERRILVMQIKAMKGACVYKGRRRASDVLSCIKPSGINEGSE
jgi:hypothetical protein